MKKLALFMLPLFGAFSLLAQKSEYTYVDGLLTIDGVEAAKITKIKDTENLGLTSTFEVSSMSGEKLIIAAYAGEFEQDPNNNMDHFYRITFLTANQIGIFTVSKMGTEKSFAKLLGKSGIFADGGLDEKKVQEFIAKKGKAPKIAMDYTTVGRNKSWPINLKEDKNIEQDSKIIGSFKDVSVKSTGNDTYEFRLPSGVVIAKATFTGGNNAQNCEMHTMKDNSKRVVPIASADNVKFSASAIDRNQLVLERIVKWLVANQYL
ncbi:hypothetical protein [Fluviicola sp.]|uniref:hypothetical protein n=1 Tax=Fluviicola sp. TaxID=1917219 RepID=UPI00262278B5|nr:hypothetical protein [Fluviicola sp.]